MFWCEMTDCGLDHLCGNSEATKCDCLASVAHINEGKAYQACLHDDNYNLC